MVAHVLVEIKAQNLDQTFSYHIPDGMQVDVGYRVLVPFGPQKLEGFVLKVDDSSSEGLKDIIAPVDDHPVLNDELLKLGNYIRNKTLCTLISAYQTMLPAALKAKKNFTVSKKYVSYISLACEEEKAFSMCQNEKQKELINLLMGGEVLKSELSKISSSSLTTLLKKGILKEEKKEQYRHQKRILEADERPILNEEQQVAVHSILKEEHFKGVLLHGVTGSGKTEVYMRLIEDKLSKNQEAILLVPEISLTPQVTEKFLRRFGSEIAILHSRLSQGEKYDEWRRIEEGKVKIVIGARSAIFAPLKNLGIIILDEEHSATYKQENTPKYHASDIALFRAKYHDIPVVFGSATPSIESYTKAKIGAYQLVELKNRVNGMLPDIHLVDMKEEIKMGNPILSKVLREKIIDRITRGEQVILLLNKRGYTRIVTCPDCGYQDKCPHCDIPLTYHKTSNMMRCHYCGYASPKKKVCPECSNESFRESGMGTEKLEEYILKEIKGTKVIRMDVDTTSKKGSHEAMIEAFSHHEANILLGTQMISKGLDFEDVTLVGVLNGDSGLNIPDFRSAERTYALLSQVAGRAGRSHKKGEVIIQGFNMDHYSILYAKEQNYEKFYEEEMRIRRTLNYSPYYNLTLLKLKGKDMTELFKEADKMVHYLREKNMTDVYILGPSVSAIPKVNDIFSIQVLLKYKNSTIVYEALKEVKSLFKKKKIILDIDVNPMMI